MPDKDTSAGKETDAAAAKNSGSAQESATATQGASKTTEQGAGKAAGSQANGQNAASTGGQAAERSAIEMLKRDHRKVEELFEQYEKASSRRKKDIVEEVCSALTIHTMLEEMIFYPACRQAADDDEPLDEAQVEHDGAKILISDLLSGNDRDEFRDAKVKVLSEYIKHHVGEEEAAGKGIFAKAKAAGLDTPELAAKLGELKTALEARREELSPSPLVSIRSPSGRDRKSQEEMMARQQGPDRDERGRFTSDDDDRRGRSSGRDRDDDRSYRSRGRDDDDGRGWYGDPEGHSEASRRGWAERRGESRSFRRDDDDDDRRSYRSEERERDDRGRFVSDDDRGGGSRSRGRYDDDDDRGYRSRGRDDDDGRGRGGWLGDSRGHAEAARRGWEDRDDDRRSSRGRNDDDDRGSRSRGRDDDDGRGRGGWFGDSRGHAEAARRGWEDRDDGGRGRSRNDDDDDRRSYRSRGRDDDDDRGRQGGWFGDSRGHAEAARRGWENRR